MIITATYYTVLCILFSTGTVLIRGHRILSFQAAKERMRNRIGKSIAVSGKFNGTILMGTGCEIKRRNFEIVRLALLAAGTCFGLLRGQGSMIVILVAAYILAEPRERIGPFTLPYGIVINVLRKRFAYRKDTEIYEALAFLKNIVATGRNSQFGADFIIEQLAGYSDLLKPIYFKMLNLLRINRKEEAIDYFAREAGTARGRDFGRLLIQMDEINPRELEETVLSYQKNIREVKITRQKQQDEMISDLLYLPVVVNVLLIFINFIYVSYFIEQKNMFGLLTY